MKRADPKIIVINLKRSPERRKEIEELMRRFSIDFDFCDAVDGKLLSDEFVGKSRERSNKWYQKDEGEGHSMRLAEIGVAVSHYNIYQKILDEKLEFAIIMEDDATFDERFVFFLTQLKNNRKVLKKFDLILLGYCTHDGEYNIPAVCSYWGRMSVGNNFKVGIPLKWYWSAIGYIISYNGASLLSQKQGVYPCVTADILTANSPMYGVKMGVITKPLIWPGEHSKISTIQIKSQEKYSANLPTTYILGKKGIFEIAINIIRDIKKSLRKMKMKLEWKQYLFTTDKY